MAASSLSFLQQTPTVRIGQTDVQRDRIGAEAPCESESLRGGERDDTFESAVARKTEQNAREDEVVLDDEQDAVGRFDALAVVVDLAVRMLFGNRARYGTDDSLLHAAAHRDGTLHDGRADVTLQRMVERERAPLADRAVDRDLAAEQRRDFAADGQAQSRPAELSRRSHVGLLERFEDDVELFFRDSDAGIGHGEGYGRPANAGDAMVARELDVERDAALVGEFEGVGEQILEDLLQAGRIGQQRLGQLFVAADDEVQVFVLSDLIERSLDFVLDLNGRDLLKIDRRRSRFDLREVEDVVDEP